MTLFPWSLLSLHLSCVASSAHASFQPLWTANTPHFGRKHISKTQGHASSDSAQPWPVMEMLETISLLVECFRKVLKKGKMYFSEHITQLQVWPGGRCHFQSFTCLNCYDVNVSEHVIYYRYTRTPPSLTAQCPFLIWQCVGFSGSGGWGWGWGVIWKRTCWRYARQVENERETRMYCKIPFCLDELKKKKKKKKKSSCSSLFAFWCHMI